MLNVGIVVQEQLDAAVADRRGRFMGHPGGEDFGAGREDEPALMGTDLGGPEVDALDASLRIPDHDLATELQRTQGKFQDTADEVGEDVAALEDALENLNQDPNDQDDANDDPNDDSESQPHA